MRGTTPELPPRPPADLAKRTPLEVKIQKGETLHRFFTKGNDPIHFDRGRDGRLNAPDDSYGVLYAAKAARGAFAETFLRNPGLTQLPTDLLASKAHVTLEALLPLKLVRMAGPGLARIGATAQVVHGGRPYDNPQTWSGALHRHPGDYDGIAYNARHDDEALCYAIFERAAKAVREAARATDLDQAWFWDIADSYGVGLAP
ncbi:MAG TPA: RES family NAD+ phosphorylase [Acetobacteraceae bacterium]|nr:RES family NAD+ phosphorylase [Acetobacteraceae bacterium]